MIMMTLGMGKIPKCKPVLVYLKLILKHCFTNAAPSKVSVSVLKKKKILLVLAELRAAARTAFCGLWRSLRLRCRCMLRTRLRLRASSPSPTASVGSLSGRLQTGSQVCKPTDQRCSRRRRTAHLTADGGHTTVLTNLSAYVTFSLSPQSCTCACNHFKYITVRSTISDLG